MLVRGLHASIAVVAAGPAARAAVAAAVAHQAGARSLSPADVEEQLQAAAAAMVAEREAKLQDQRAAVAGAGQALDSAAKAAADAASESTRAGDDLARLDELASRLAAAEETYEAAVRADAEAARSLAAALGELDRILGQRHSASTSLDQARQSREHRGVPEAVLAQATNLQAALANAESDKRDAVQQADETSQAARAASRDALASLEAAHSALRAGMAGIASGAPEWGTGVPLPGLVATYRDKLAADAASAQATEAQAQEAERAARAALDEQQDQLEELEGAGDGPLAPGSTVATWLNGPDFDPDEAVLADDAFRRFGAPGAAELITALAGHGCQVVYLTDDPDVLSWAIGLPNDVGGATTVPTAPGRRPALVGG